MTDAAQQELKPTRVVENPSVTGDLRLHEFHSRVFHNTRMLRVWLPAEYDAAPNSSRHYPLLYLNDGQNLFDRAIAFGGAEWEVDETAERLIRQKKIPPLIVVGIDNAQADRMKEFVPYRSLQPPILRPRGRLYPEFLIREVMPFICEQYRVARGPENTGLGGSSLGALISLYTIIKHSGVFGRLLLESPSLYISQRRILKASRDCRQWPEKIYIGIGTREAGREDKDRQVVNDVRELERILRPANLGDERLLVKVEQGAIHNERDWARRFPDAVTFLFGNAISSG
jgi:predicted alpha/beta superfamily hydrolase